ncbi:MAG: hypothetical protein SFV55_27375 [Haliscomenobacter sp.]|uniref:hypothetical protein n=1 Tax=Haliscomenobacter sp. TaxID=2717303 RepID=UPI0029A92E9F|nr:hypothetical protein [Haliscomenobacter sp.]MDX2072187.1 hypothetical protein [Haliscomenobacter sp.]
MKTRFLIQIMVFSLAVLGQSIAQSDLQNRCLVHLDKSFYVSGELIWFKVYLPASLRDQNFNIKVGVLNPAGRPIESFFISSQGENQSSGHYKIPFDCSAGVYQLQFSALETSTKRPVLLAEVLVPIYNDLDKVDAQVATSTHSASVAAATLQDLQVEIRLPQNNYQAREQVQGKIQVKNREGNPVPAQVSIVVSDWELNGTAVWPQANWSLGPVIAPATLSKQVYTQVKLQSNAATQSQNLVGVFFPQNWQLLYTSSQRPEYWVEVPAFTGSKQVQFLGHPNPDVQVQLLESFPTKASPPLSYTPGIRQYLEWSRMRKKVYQLYNALEMTLPGNTAIKDSIPLKADRNIRPAEFEAFEDLATFFREISTPLSFKQERKTGIYSAKMYNPGTFTDYPSAPVFVIDGKMTRDADFVARLKCSQIESIDLYYQPTQLLGYFKAIGRSGVVHIRSKAEIAIPAAEAEDIFHLNGLQAAAAFPALNSAQLQAAPTQAFFRPQLYWLANLRTDAQGQADFSFWQGDDWSRFQIQVIVQSSDGRLGEGQLLYEVGKQ